VYRVAKRVGRLIRCTEWQREWEAKQVYRVAKRVGRLNRCTEWQREWGGSQKGELTKKFFLTVKDWVSRRL
jgi:hypothetical protein